MGFEKNYLEIDLSTDSTFDVVLEAEYNIVYVTGTAGGNVAIGVDGGSTPRKGMEVRFVFDGDMASNTLSLFGTNVTAISTGIKTVYDLFYNGTSWVHIYNPSTNTAFVTNSQVAGGANVSLDKLATVTANRAIQSTAGGQFEASPTTTTDLAKLSAITVSASQINNVGATTSVTNDLNLLAGSALAGLTPTEIQYLIGVTSNLQTQLNAKANSADFSGLVEIKSFSVTIPSAQVLTLATTPVTLIPAQGAGLKIIPIAIQASIDFNSVAYTVADEVDIYAGGNRPCVNLPIDFLFATVSKTVVCTSQITSILATDTQIVANSPLTIWAEAGGSNPASGDSDITISGLYIVTT